MAKNDIFSHMIILIDPWWQRPLQRRNTFFTSTLTFCGKPLSYYTKSCQLAFHLQRWLSALASFSFMILLPFPLFGTFFQTFSSCYSQLDFLICSNTFLFLLFLEPLSSSNSEKRWFWNWKLKVTLIYEEGLMLTHCKWIWAAIIFVYFPNIHGHISERLIASICHYFPMNVSKPQNMKRNNTKGKINPKVCCFCF